MYLYVHIYILCVLYKLCIVSINKNNNVAHNATIDNLLTLLHVRSEISYIEGFDGSDKDDLIELVATL